MRGRQIKPPTPGGGGNVLNYALAGIGTGGLLYLVFRGRSLAHNAGAQNYLMQQ